MLILVFIKYFFCMIIRWRYICWKHTRYFTTAVIHIVWSLYSCRHRLDDSRTEGEHLPHVGLHAPGSPSAGRAGEGRGRVLSHHQHQLREVRREVSVSTVCSPNILQIRWKDLILPMQVMLIQNALSSYQFLVVVFSLDLWKENFIFCFCNFQFIIIIVIACSCI